MSGSRGHEANRAAELRRAFDEGFAEPTHAGEEAVENFLDVRVGGRGYAVRIAEVAGLFVDRKIVSLPSSMPEFLGLAGLRGGTVPVYSLGALLGHPLAGESPRWLILTGLPHPVGLAFDELLGHLRIVPSEILPPQGHVSGAHVIEAARLVNGLRSVLALRSIVETIDRRTGALGPIKEQ